MLCGALCKPAGDTPRAAAILGWVLVRMSEGERLPYVGVLECEIRSHSASTRLTAAHLASKLRCQQETALA